MKCGEDRGIAQNTGGSPRLADALRKTPGKRACAARLDRLDGRRWPSGSNISRYANPGSIAGCPDRQRISARTFVASTLPQPVSSTKASAGHSACGQQQISMSPGGDVARAGPAFRWSASVRPALRMSCQLGSGEAPGCRRRLRVGSSTREQIVVAPRR